jgi:tetratricopeptide (TPR) repeat protein
MTVLSQLGTLERAGLIQLAAIQPELEYLFRHVLVKDAAYFSLVKNDRWALHRAAAETLEALEADPSDGAPRADRLAELGHHFAEAQLAGRACHYFTLAGDAAASQYANAEAIGHYSRALGFLPELDLSPDQIAHLYVQCGRALELSGQYSAALANYVELQALARERGDRRLELIALTQRAIGHAVANPAFDPQQALQLAGAAQAIAVALDDRLALARLAWARMLAHAGADAVSLAVQAGEEALALVRPLDQPELLATILTDLSRLYLAVGRVDLGQEALDEAERMWRRRRNLPMLAETITSRGAQHFFRGEYQQALAILQEGFELGQSIGNAWGMSFNLMMRSYVLLDQGDFQAAVDTMQHCLALAIEGDFIFPQTDTRAMLALAYGFLGQPDRASNLAAEALAIAEQKLPVALATVFLVHAWLALMRGELDEAERHMRRARVHFNPEDYLSANRYFLHLIQSELALARGQPAEALHHEAEVAALHARLGFRIFMTSTLRLRGRALLALGRLAEAEAALREGHDLAQSQPSYRSRWLLCLDLADLASARTDPAAHDHWRAEARAALEALLDRLTRPDLRGPFLAQPEVQATLAGAPA